MKEQTRKRVVILGGGFGGIYTALHLEKALSKRDDVMSGQKRNEVWETLGRCLSETSTNHVAAFTLREIDGLSSEEVCDAFNMSHSNL